MLEMVAIGVMVADADDDDEAARASASSSTLPRSAGSSVPLRRDARRHQHLEPDTKEHRATPRQRDLVKMGAHISSVRQDELEAEQVDQLNVCIAFFLRR